MTLIRSDWFGSFSRTVERWGGRATGLLAKDRNVVLLILLVGALRAALIYFSWSPALGADGDNYLVPAVLMANGQRFFYPIGTLTYPAMGAVSLSMFNSLYPLIAFQIALSIVAGVALYFALKPYHHAVAVLTAALVVFNPQLGYWQNFFSTDGMYGTLQILAFAAFLVHMPPRRQPAWYWIAALGLFLGVAYTERSVGILAIVPAALVYLLARRSWWRAGLLVASYGLMILLLAGWLWLHTGHFGLDGRYHLNSDGEVQNMINSQDPPPEAETDPERALIEADTAAVQAEVEAAMRAEAGENLVVPVEVEPAPSIAEVVNSLLTPTRIRMFANFFVFTGRHSGGGNYPVTSQPWRMEPQAQIPGLEQVVSWLMGIWDGISSTVWMAFGALIMVMLPGMPVKWPVLFSLLLFTYHAAAVSVFNRVVPRYVVVVSVYRELMFAFVVVFAVQGLKLWRRQVAAGMVEAAAD